MSNRPQPTLLGLKPFGYEKIKIMPEHGTPEPVGFFSVTPERRYDPSASQLRYYQPPSPKEYPLDLNVGPQLARMKPALAYDEKLKFLLQFIQEHYDELFIERENKMGRRQLDADFVSTRHTLKLIMCTPYEIHNNWCILVTKFMGTYYMWTKEFKHPYQTEQDVINTSWDIKMEQFCLSESPTKPATKPPQREDVSACAEFTCVFKTKFGGFNLLYGADIDAVETDRPVDLQTKEQLKNLNFVGVRCTAHHPGSYRRKVFNKYIARPWWCQSFLTGIDEIYAGMRNTKGIVRRIENFKTQTIPNKTRKYWRPAGCVKFLIQFLQCAKSLCKVDDPYSTYTFHFDAKQAKITYGFQQGRSQDAFLPDWYIKQLKMPSKRRHDDSPPSSSKRT